MLTEKTVTWTIYQENIGIIFIFERDITILLQVARNSGRIISSIYRV